MKLARRRRLRNDDEGMSLVEVVVALGLMAVVLLALLSSSVFAVQATVDGRKNQQAADYLNQAIENARSLDYNDAVLLTSQVAGDPAVVTSAGVPQYDPGGGLEPVASTATGTVRPQRETVSTSNGSYTIKQYVTVPVGTPLTTTGTPSVRRLTVVVSWISKTGTHTRRSSTMLTATRRGLPLPNFTWKYTGPATITAGVPTWTKNPGNDVSYGLVLNNLGARDAWSLTASTSGWSYYRDTNQDGLWSGDVLVEPALAGSTGLIEPGSAPFYLVAHRTIGVGESGTSSTVFTATSEAVTTVSKAVNTALVVQGGAVVPPPQPSPTATPSPASGPCTPTSAPALSATNTVPAATTHQHYTLRTAYLYGGSDVDTSTTSSNAMGTSTSALVSRLCNWSTDLQSGFAGRLVQGSSAATRTAANTAEFRFQPGSGAEDEFRGSPVLSLYAQCPGVAPTLTVKVLTLVGTTYNERSTTTWPLSGCNSGGFTRVSTLLDAATFSLPATTNHLVVRITSNADVRLGYGSTSSPADFTIGMK